MAHDRKPEARRRRAASPESTADPIGRLDEVLVTLEQMLEDRGVAPAPGERGVADVSESSGGGPGGQETLPLLRDVVAPAPVGRAEAGEGAPARVTEGPELSVDEPLPLGFEIVPDEALPSPGEDVEPDPPAAVPPVSPVLEGERYGDTLPPSLDPEVYRHLIERIANEIDVIVQTGTEEAMRRAAVDIAARVREHVAIILPEVIEELVRMSNRPSD